MNEEYSKTIRDIHQMMTRSSRFISLSGLSGVFAGIYALGGISFAWFKLRMELFGSAQSNVPIGRTIILAGTDLIQLIAVAMLVLVLSFATAVLLTRRNAKKNGDLFWDANSRQMLVHLMVPLTAGGILCLVMLKYGVVVLMIPATLIFYGLGLFSAGRYTHGEVKYLGLAEVTLGLISAWYLNYGMLLWAIGFGLLHIIYGIHMWNKYER